jgi:synaptosomal-associated protein 25
MDKINTDMKEAEKNLTGMEKCCGICVCPCYKYVINSLLFLFILIIFISIKRSKEFKEDAGTWKSSEDGKIVSGQPTRVVDERNGAGPMTTQYIAKYAIELIFNFNAIIIESNIYNSIVCNLRITKDAREDEMEENMGQVSTMIGNLRNMAIDMGSEIGSQNQQLDRINQKVFKLLFRTLNCCRPFNSCRYLLKC